MSRGCTRSLADRIQLEVGQLAILVLLLLAIHVVLLVCRIGAIIAQGFLGDGENTGLPNAALFLRENLE